MRKYFNVELKENDVVDFESLAEKLVIPQGFKKELNFIEIEQLLDMQLLEDGLRMDNVFQTGGCRVIKASKNFKVRNTGSKRLNEYLTLFDKGWVVNIKDLEGLGFEEGEELLLRAGYGQVDSEKSDSNIADYMLDLYYVLSDEDGEELDRKSFVQHLNENNNPLNDDGSDDFVVKEGWEQA